MITAKKMMLLINMLVCITFYSQAAAAKESNSTLQTITLESKSLQGNRLNISPSREVIISLPPSYNSSSKKYPVVYLLHGLGATASAWLSEDDTQPNVQKSLEKLYADKSIEEMIVVIPDSYNEHFLGGWYSNSTSGGNWEDYIIKDLIPYIDNNYRTKAVKAHRGITGHSMGAFGAFKLGMKHTDLFGAIYAMSTPLITASGYNYITPEMDFNLINQTFSKKQNQWQWVDKFYYSLGIMFAPDSNKPFYAQLPISNKQITEIKSKTIASILPRYLNQLKKASPVIKLDVGINDGMLIEEVRAFSALLNEQELPHEYNEYDGAHGDKLYLLVKNDLFQFFSRNITQ